MTKNRGKSFITDGISLRDFEKIVTGIAFLLSVIAILILAMWKEFVDGTLCLYSSGLGTLFVVRKVAKYNLDAKLTNAHMMENNSGEFN
jgi:hypothetical protein